MKELNDQSLEELQRLSKIKLSENEKPNLLDSLQRILEYVEQLSDIDTTNVRSCNHVSQVQSQNVFRKDEVEEILSRDVFLKNSPDQIGGMIRIPTIIKQD